MTGTEGQVPVFIDRSRPNVFPASEHTGEFDSLYLPVSLEGMPVQCLVDSGSTLSVLHSNCYHSIPKQKQPKLSCSAGMLCMADGGLVPSNGEAIFTLDLGSNTVCHHMVVADIDTPGILGMDFLKSHDSVLDAKRATLSDDGHQHKCVASRDMTAVFRVTVGETVTVAPGYEMIVPGQVQGSPGYTTALV